MTMAAQPPQWLDSIPAFKAVQDKQGVLGALLGLLQKGVQAFSTVVRGSTVFFLGDGGKLYKLDAEARGDPQAVSGQWQFDEGAMDLSCLHISSMTGTGETFVLDTDMRLFRVSEAGLTRCLTETRVGQVACGEMHAAVVTSNGLAFACGYNSRGQLGLGHTDAVSDMTPMRLPNSQFYTSVACGSDLTVLLCNDSVAYGFGYMNGARHLSPLELKSPGGRFVKVACGYDHALFLTATGLLAGCGRNENWELTSLAACSQPKPIPFEAEKGQLRDIFCHPSFRASVVLTSDDKFYVCGDVGALFGGDTMVQQFFLYDYPAVILNGRLVCQRPPTGSVRMPGFDNPDYCDVELTIKKSSESETLEADGAAAVGLAGELLPALPQAAVVQLALLPLHQGNLSAGDVLRHIKRQKSQVPEEEEAVSKDSVHVGWDVVRARSPYLWTLLNSDIQGGVEKQSARRWSVSLGGHSLTTLRAYCQFLHEDRVISDAVVAIELLGLAREYCDENGLAAQCLWVAKHQVSAKDLPICLQKCIELERTALAVELVKRQLCSANCCDVLHAAEMKSADDPHVEYIREMAMAFAVEHATALIASDGFSKMDNCIKARLLTKLAELNYLKR